MEELQNLLAHLKNRGLTDAKIPIDVWCGIVEYFANKPKPKQCNIADVSNRRELLLAFAEYWNGCKNSLIEESNIDEFLKSK
jgi:hypothetical protein